MFKSKSKKMEELPERSQTPQPSKSKKKLFGRKKEEVEPVPQLDLHSALPASDNFRTSLLMPSLSTRFSMLREQDDPNSLLGKANDDSVLQTNRKSRLVGFDMTGLSDIAEVASIHSAIRPPFAGGARSASYHTDASVITVDDDSSTNGSIMSRARPGEGNMLFGGRQKIYKIPVGDAGSVKNLGGQEQRGMRGRALYEDDVHMSAFQKYKEQERLAERERRLNQLEQEMLNDDNGNSFLNSPSLSTFDEKRGTTSSTGSGRMSGSTAATSVHSHGLVGGSAAQSPMTTTPQSAGAPPPLARSNSRRLYDTNLDHNMAEQQVANLTRMNSMQRKPSLNGPGARPYLHGSRSATNLRERFVPTLSSESSRAASPLPPPPTNNLTTFDTLKSPIVNAHSPVSPIFHDVDNPLNQAVDAKDRGKATALGQFNRPKQFDEQQFLQRQRSLHQQNIQRNDTRSPRPPIGRPPAGRPSNEGRRPSTERKPFFPPRRPSEEARSRAGSAQGDRPGFATRPHAGSGRSDRRPPVVDSRPRAGTNRTASGRPSLDTNTSNYSGPPSPMTGRPATAGQQEPRYRNISGQRSQPASAVEQTGTAFYDSPILNNESPLLGRQSPVEASPMEASPKISLERGTQEDVPAPLMSPRSPPPQLRDHPALRSAGVEPPPLSPLSPMREERRKAMSPDLIPDNFQPPVSRGPSDAGLPQMTVDSTPDATRTSDSTSPNQLNGLIRSHLRHASTASSIYPMNDDERQRQSVAFDLTIPPNFSEVNYEAQPWQGEGGEPGPQTTPFGDGDLNPDNIGVAVASPAQDGNPNMDLPPGPRPNDADEWMNELRKQHTRDASTETQHEREAFAEDIRLRQKAIQENLRIKNEFGARSPSPGHVKEKQNMFEGGLKPFGLLRKSSSREDVNKKKAGLGISAGNGSGRNTPNGPPLSFRQPPMGRTLHMRMPEATRQSEDSVRGRSASRPRKASEANSMLYRTPPDSSRTSTSNDGPSGRQSEAGGDIRRSEFPSGFQSTHPSARPSLDSMRQRSDSSAMSRNVPPVPPLRTAVSGPTRPPMASLSTTNSVPSTAAVSPILPGTNTPPLSTTSMSSPDLRGQTNTSLAQTPLGNIAPVLPSTLPPSTYTFPLRADKDRPAAAVRRAGRSPTINKQDISQPTLISSTSNFETMELDEKRQQLQAMSMGALSVQSPSAMGPTQAVSSPTRRGFFGRNKSPPESGQISGEDSSGQSTRSKVSKESEEDDFMTRPAEGRLRIRKVSSEDGGLQSSRSHQAVRAELAESRERSIAGGMI